MRNKLKYCSLIVFLSSFISVSCGQSKISVFKSRKNIIVSKCGSGAMGRTEGFVFFNFFIDGRENEIKDLDIGIVGTYRGKLVDAYITEKCLAIKTSSKENYYVASKFIGDIFAAIINSKVPDDEYVIHQELDKKIISRESIIRCGLPRADEKKNIHFIPIDTMGAPSGNEKTNNFQIMLSGVNKQPRKLNTNQYGCIQIEEKDKKEIVELVEYKTKKIIYRRAINIWSGLGLQESFQKFKINLCIDGYKNYFYKGQCYSYFNYLCLQSDTLLLPYGSFFNMLKNKYPQLSCVKIEETVASNVKFISKSDQTLILEPIFHFMKLKEIEFSGNQISDISPLKNLTNLTSLSLYGNRISDISVIKNLTGLTEIDLDKNQISDISELSNLTALYHLNLSNNQISDVSPLKDLTSLTSLSLGSNKITDISVLKELTSLTSLFLAKNQIKDISGLKKLTTLTDIVLNDSQINDVYPLKDLINLDALNLDNNQISDVSPLKNLTSLTSLSLDSNKISDISGLKDLTSLNWLNLDSNKISDISGLKDLTSLTWLNLDGNQINDVSPLKGLTSLNYLYLNDSQINDVSPLKDLTSLAELSLKSGQIIDISPLKNMTNLAYLYLEKNPLGTTVEKTAANCPTDGKSKGVADWCKKNF